MYLISCFLPNYSVALRSAYIGALPRVSDCSSDGLRCAFAIVVGQRERRSKSKTSPSLFVAHSGEERTLRGGIDSTWFTALMRVWLSVTYLMASNDIVHASAFLTTFRII